MSWPTARLGDLCRIEKGVTGIQKAIPGDYPMVVTSDGRKSHNEYQFDDDAVIIPLVSSTGHGHKSLKRIHFQQGKFALGSILCAIIPKDKALLNTEYLYRYLDLNKENELVARMKGMANVTLPLNELIQIEIPLPPIEEQIEFTKKYKHLENNSDLIINQFSSQLDLLKKLRQQILQDAIQGKLVPQDPKDEPANILLEKIRAEKGKLIKEKKLKKEKSLPPIKPEEIPFQIPENWVWCRLGEIVSILGDGLHGTPNYSDNGEYFFINGNNLIKGSIEYKENTKRVSEEEYLKYKKTMNSNTVLVSINGSLGNLAFYNGEKIILGKSACYFNLLSGVKKFFIGLLISSIYFLKYAVDVASETTIKNVSLKSMRNFLIPLPPLSEQNRIISKVEQLMKVCNEMEQTVTQNQNFTRQLLQVALKEALEQKE